MPSIVALLCFAASLSSHSSDLLAPPQLQGEQNAYIPYIYARECIQKVSHALTVELFWQLVSAFPPALNTGL